MATSPRRPETSSESLQIDGRPLRILLLEDEFLLRMDVEQMLIERGAEIVAATADGEACLLLAERYAPDIAVMDVGVLGKMDGVDAARVMRHRFAIPVVFVTGTCDPATLARIGELDGCEVLFKPCVGRDLAAAIRRACGFRRAH